MAGLIFGPPMPGSQSVHAISYDLNLNIDESHGNGRGKRKTRAASHR
ncbi:MAG: hypothetical protein KDK33_02550 [Leptospiraceae bacterium]|nr:hypothetical protein [Leptospiraceae bacterium]